MAFPHVMPLLCRIWRFPWLTIPPAGAPAVDNVPCWLQQWHGEWYFVAAGDATNPPGRFLYMPKGTDVRITPPFPFNNGDLIECPKGSGTWYQVLDVQDWNKGTPNEERRASLYWIDQTTYPIP